MAKSAESRKEADALLERQRKDNESFFLRNYTDDYLNSRRSQNQLAALRDALRANSRSASNDAVVMGATQEARANQKAASANVINQAVRSISAEGEARNQNILGMYLNRKAAIDGGNMDVLSGRQQAYADAANSGMEGIGVAAAGLMDELQKK